MSNFYDMFIFNRFPINKEFFLEFLIEISRINSDIHTLLFVEPRTFDRIYFTMKDSELQSIAKRKNNIELANFIPEYDAIYSYNSRCIILHIPSMAIKLSTIPFLSEDPEGKMLFIIHFFSCFFHELAHAYHFTQIQVNSLGAILSNKKPPEFSVDESEKIAENYEEKLVKEIGEIVYQSGSNWIDLADVLFTWEKLKPVLMVPRNLTKD